MDFKTIKNHITKDNNHLLKFINERVHFPVLVRSSFSLGGMGSGFSNINSMGTNPMNIFNQMFGNTFQHHFIFGTPFEFPANWEKNHVSHKYTIEGCY